MIALADEHGDQLEVEDGFVVHTVVGLVPLLCVENAGLVFEVLRDGLLHCADVGLDVVVALTQAQFGLDYVVHDVKPIYGVHFAILEGPLPHYYHSPVELKTEGHVADESVYTASELFQFSPQPHDDGLNLIILQLHAPGDVLDLFQSMDVDSFNTGETVAQRVECKLKQAFLLLLCGVAVVIVIQDGLGLSVPIFVALGHEVALPYAVEVLECFLWFVS